MSNYLVVRALSNLRIWQLFISLRMKTELHPGGGLIAGIRKDSILTYKFKMRKGGFEPPHLSAPPPQDGVSTGSTTSANALANQFRRPAYYSPVGSSPPDGAGGSSISPPGGDCSPGRVDGSPAGGGCTPSSRFFKADSCFTA